MIRLLACPVARYIERQRDRLMPLSTPLPKELKGNLRPYFDDCDLDRVRIIQSVPLPIPNPPFYSLITKLGFSFPSPSLVAAITLDHVIAAREAMSTQLLFHEMVHVVQFRLLGVRRFSELYVRGFLSSGAYEKIPLEQNAFELEARFEDGQPFSVSAAVSRWILPPKVS